MRFSWPILAVLLLVAPLASTGAQDEEPCAGECGGPLDEGCETVEGAEHSKTETESTSYCTATGQYTSTRYCNVVLRPVSIVCRDENGQITSQSARFKEISKTCGGWIPPIP